MSHKQPDPASTRPPARCHACGRSGCPASDDPHGGTYPRHNAAAYAALLQRRATNTLADEVAAALHDSPNP